MSLRPAQIFNLIVASAALLVAAEVALLWKLSQRKQPIAPLAVSVAPTPAAPLFTAPGAAQQPDSSSSAVAGPATTLRRPASSAAPLAARSLSQEARAQAKTYFDAASAALSKGDKRSALESFRRVVGIAPDHLPTRLNLALLYLEAKAPALALPHLRKATSIAPKDPAARFELARTLIALKRPQEAIEPLREVVRLAPKERGARALLAQIYASQKRPTDAYSQWAAAAQNDARDLEAHLQAAGLAADALKRPNDAEKWLRRAEKGVPRDPRPPLLLGRLLLARGDAKGAARALSNANRLAPDALEIYPILADARIAARDLRGARGAIQSALTRLPRGQNAAQKAQIRGIEGGFRLTLGRILGQMKKPREAKIEFARAVEALPRDPNALSLLATASAQMGDLTGATKALQKALEIDAKRAGDRRFLAQVLAQSKNYSAASEQFALYTRLQPRDMGALAQWVEVAAQKRDRALELEILGKLVALDSKNPAPHLQRGVILRDLKRPREALNSFNRALKMRPQDPNVLFEVARLETQLKQPKSAALTWQKIIVVRPDFLPAYPALLQNSSQSGQTPSARLFLARRLATNENPRALSEILRFYEKNRRNSEAEALLIDIVRRNPRTRAAKAALDSFKVVTPKATSTPSPSPTPVPSPSATPAEAAKPTEETPAAP